MIAAITSCTNTSNPSVLMAAGLLAQKAVAQGPDQQAVGQDLARARLAGRHRLPHRGRRDGDLEKLGFYLAGYGCTTCIGNSGPVHDEIANAVKDGNLVGGLVSLVQLRIAGWRPSQP